MSASADLTRLDQAATTILDQIGGQTLTAICGGRARCAVLSLDGRPAVEIPSSDGRLIQVIVAPDGTYTVRRLKRDGEYDTVKHQVTGVACGQLGDIVWRAANDVHDDQDG